MTSSQEPLISSDARDEDALYDHVDIDPAAAGSGTTDGGRPSLFVLVLTFAAGISGLLFGCMFGLLGPA